MKFVAALFIFLIPGLYSGAQVNLGNISFFNGTLQISSLTDEQGKSYLLTNALPLFSMLVNGEKVVSDVPFKITDDSISAGIFPGLIAEVAFKQEDGPTIHCIIRFRNESQKNIVIENVVPFGESEHHPYITAAGTKEWPQYLCRSRLFRPGYAPVGVVLPDNAWHMGWSDVETEGEKNILALTRRGKRENSDIDRWAATVKPGGWIEYSFRFEIHDGDWHRGLELMFRDRWLYDLKEFDNSLFRREDLSWMRHTYLMLLQFAWDKTWYDSGKQDYTFYNEFSRYDKLTGGWDIYTIWPTWPRLGLDQRNQFDMYRHLPGGQAEVKKQSDYLHLLGKKYFISYNPWDESTRKEEHMAGLEQLIRETGADGVVLDCKGESSRELQAAADKAKPGVIMYSEGMAVPRDMPGIVSGRVHNVLYMPPPVNLNKFIKPDFAIYRVIDLAESDIHREIAVSFFNGYGIEINTMRPGRPGWVEDEFRFMGQTTRILRENTTAFTDLNWQPFVETLHDSIWVNRWNDGEKTVYTVYSLEPEGFTGALFPVQQDENHHFVSLWNHEESMIREVKGNNYAEADIKAFNRSWIGSRKEGAVECIARLPEILKCSLDGDSLEIKADGGDEIRIWAGNPAYSATPLILEPGDRKISLRQHFGDYEDKFVVQLFDNKQLLDENILHFVWGTPRLVSVIEQTVQVLKAPKGMIEIPAGKFNCTIRRDSLAQEAFIPFPDYSQLKVLEMKRFFMDKYPVTNAEFYDFLQATGYEPADTVNFLKHWVNRKPPVGLENHPVVYVSLLDAEAYAKWDGKRLPTETEWQYSAQGTDQRRYPWGNVMDSTRCNYNLNHTTPVDLFRKGASPFGVMDIIGNVWQLTNDVYDNGSYRYNIIRGGSYYHPASSIWYVTGGPVPVNHPEMILMVSPSLDRCATIGFRCVKDAK
jgi:formylglycine-generating enzyme required for sulfatase activity